jgi:dTMP kinase
LTLVSRPGGWLIAFEGGEGSGKSTQVRLLAEWLAQRGIPAVASREPGGTGVSEAIRRVLLDPASRPMSPETELLLYAAARAQLVSELIEPALAEGKVVLLDRFEDSTFAYQGGARALAESDVRRANEIATGGRRPDLVVLLDLPPEEGRRRRRGDRTRAGDDRMEGEGAEFHDRVLATYRARAAREPDRFFVVDGRGSPTTIQEQVRRRVLALIAPERD